MSTQTVRGPIESIELGITLPHEHVTIDYRCAWNPPPKDLAYLIDTEITEELWDVVRNNAHFVKSNLVLEDTQRIIEELAAFRKAGGQSVVSLTNYGLSPQPEKLLRISETTDLNIVAGTGFYRYIGQDDITLQMTRSEICERIVRDLAEGIADTKIRAGIIGEVGTSYPLHPFENESLVGAAMAQQVTGATINVHPEVWEHGHLEVLDILEAAGADLTQIIMSHVDQLVEPDWHLKIAERGVFLSFDTFGSEFVCDGIPEPRDHERIKCLLALMDAGYTDRLLLSHDICYKVQMKTYGGRGYDHVLTTIVPKLKEAGVSDEEVTQMLILNPATSLEMV